MSARIWKYRRRKRLFRNLARVFLPMICTPAREWFKLDVTE